MILINKVTPFATENYYKDLIECINHNSGISFIKVIVVFHNNSNIILPNNSKVKLIIKNGYSDYDIIEYCKGIYKNEVFIFSNPFVKFNNTLINLERPLKKTIKIENDCFIFNRNINIKKSEIIENLFESFESSNKITLDRKQIWSDNLKSNNLVVRDSGRSARSVNLRNIRKKEQYLRKKSELTIIPPKIDVIIVSVDYNDFLSITLESTSKLFNVTVVTSSNDEECQELCKRYNVNCVITERMYENGAMFNKGKAINEGIKSLKNPEWILLLDADIYVKSDFLDILKRTDMRSQSLLVCKRLLIEDYDSFVRWKSGEDVGRMERAKGFGYFQMFNINKFRSDTIFPENSNDASFSDLEFRDKFNKNEIEINTHVIHLGRTCQNWEGRKTDKFVEEEFDINQYFDKIYCLNLDRRTDRWKKSSKEFSKFSIKAERWSATDGKKLNKKEISLLENNTDERILSDIGRIENKFALACLLSHLEIIKDAKSNNYKKILIFEDDIIISNKFIEEVSKIKKLEWKLLYLGASQFLWGGIEIKNGYYNCNKTLGTFAYAVESSIYDDLINIFEKRNKSVDNFLSLIQSKYKNQCITLYPNIIISDVGDSEIRESKNMEDYSKIMRWNLEDFVKSNNKSISIIIPCYGHSKYLMECVDSCINQSVKPNEILILLMDDDSILMKNKLEKKSNLIKCLIGEKYHLSKARNICIDVSESDYFIPLDADDTIPENFIEEVSKKDADVVYVGSKYFGSISGNWPNPIEEEVDWTKLTTFRRNSLVCTALIKKESYIKSGKYNEELWAFEDMDMWIRMYKNNFKFEKSFETFLNYRKHESSNSLLSKANSTNDNRSTLIKSIMKDDFYKKTPKIIHWVWIGEKPIPKDVIDTWFKHLSYGEWNIMMWNENNFDMNSCEFLKKAFDSKKYGICVDYIRAKVLYEFGGVWLDADCVINKDISPFLQYDFFGSWENESYINIGLIGCSPKLQIMKNILDYYTNLDVSEDVIKSQSDFVSKVGTGPMVLTNELLKIKNIRNGGFTEFFKEDEKRYLIETPDVFVLDDSNNGRINYAVHLFDGSWTDKKEEWSQVVMRSYENWKIKNKI